MSMVTSVPDPTIVCQSIEPLSSPWISVRTICVPSPPADLPFGQAHARVAHPHVEAILGALGDDLDLALLIRKAVLDGVRDELGEREGERGRVGARKRAERAGLDRARARVG